MRINGRAKKKTSTALAHSAATALKLMNLFCALTEEEPRVVREGLDEDHAAFDLIVQHRTRLRIEKLANVVLLHVYDKYQSAEDHSYVEVA